MSYEVEQKFRLADPAAFEARLTALGLTVHPAIVQADHYFNHPARDFAQTDEALRIRTVGDANYVTYKGPKIDATTKTRREIELSIASGVQGAEQFAEMLALLGFQSVATVRKRRRTADYQWKGHEVEIALDDVEGVGRFCELELSAEQDGLDAARAALASLAAELGLTTSERRSYLEMLLTG